MTADRFHWHNEEARMTEIDIDSLDESMLTALNRRIVERLQF